MTFMTKVALGFGQCFLSERPARNLDTFYESILEEFERRTFIQAQWEETFKHLELNTI